MCTIAAALLSISPSDSSEIVWELASILDAQGIDDVTLRPEHILKVKCCLTESLRSRSCSTVERKGPARSSKPSSKRAEEAVLTTIGY